MRKSIGTKLVEGGLAVILSLASGCSQVSSFREYSANDYLRNFPERIVGAKEIKKYETLNARFCLVHIQQVHFSDDNELNSSILGKVVRIQTNIYHIVNSLKEKGFLKKFYSEGLTSGSVPVYREFVDEIASKGFRTVFISDASFRLAADGMDFEGAENKYEWDNAKSEILKWDREIQELAQSKKGREEILRKSPSLKVRRLTTDGQLIEKIIDGREDGVLRVAARNCDRNAIVIYGAAHAWGGKYSCGEKYDMDKRLSNRDNIAVWNARWPNSKFSLIEIKPMGLD